MTETKRAKIQDFDRGIVQCRVEWFVNAVSAAGCKFSTTTPTFNDVRWTSIVGIEKPAGIKWQDVMEAISEADRFATYTTEDTPGYAVKFR